MRWRFIPFEKYDPYVKTALNEVLIESVSKEQEGIFWLSGWNESCVNIGFGQNVLEVLDLKEIRKRNLKIVRRQGGGGAMYLDKNNEISWAMIFPEYHLKTKNPGLIYEMVCAMVVKTLKDLGIKSRHRPINDVVTEKGKISGSTLKK